jgi:hypothetical protein
LACLFAKLLEKIPSFGFERSRVRKYGNGDRKHRNLLEPFERMVERCTSFSIPDILIEKQIRQGSDDKNVGSKRFKNCRDTPDKFCQLEAGKGSGHPNEGVESRRGKSAFPRETRYQERANLIGTVEIKNAPLIEQDSRKKVVRESRHFRAAVEKSQLVVGQYPRIPGGVLPRVR